MSTALVLGKYTDAAKQGIIAEGGYSSRVNNLTAAMEGVGGSLGDYWVCDSQEWDAAFFMTGPDNGPAFQAALNTVNEASGHIAEWRVIPVAPAADVDEQLAGLIGKAVKPPE